MKLEQRINRLMGSQASIAQRRYVGMSPPPSFTSSCGNGGGKLARDFSSALAPEMFST